MLKSSYSRPLQNRLLAIIGGNSRNMSETPICDTSNSMKLSAMITKSHAAAPRTNMATLKQVTGGHWRIPSGFHVSTDNRFRSGLTSPRDVSMAKA